MAGTTDLEKQSLEAHVDLCALRYETLDKRLDTLETKVDTMHQDVVNGNKSLAKVIITTAGTMIAGVLSVVATLIFTAG